MNEMNRASVRILFVSVILKERITRKTFVDRRIQPFDGHFRFVEQSVSGSDVVSGVVKMAEARPNLDGALNCGFRLQRMGDELQRFQSTSTSRTLFPLRSRSANQHPHLSRARRNLDTLCDFGRCLP